MPRIRTIKPEFFTSLTIAGLTLEQRLTFIGMWTHVDDEGRCVDDPRLIKAALWPLDDRTTADIETDLDAIHAAGLITRYTITEDSLSNHGALKRRSCIAITTWSEHQHINRPTKSKLPGPEQGKPRPPNRHTSENGDSLNTHGELTEDSRQERNREQGKEQGKERPTAAPYTPPERANARELAANLNSTAISGTHAGTAYRLVQHITPNLPSSTRTALARETAALLEELEPDHVQQALERWNGRTGIGPKMLPNLAADIAKEQAGAGTSLAAQAPTRAAGGQTRPSTTDTRMAQTQALREQMRADGSLDEIDRRNAQRRHSHLRALPGSTEGASA